MTEALACLWICTDIFIQILIFLESHETHFSFVFPQGDSGGPLVTRNKTGQYVLAGIVSQGNGCGNKDYPGLYANMRYPPYLAWVKKVAFTA